MSTLREQIKTLVAEWDREVHEAHCGTPPSCGVRTGCDGNAGEKEREVLRRLVRKALRAKDEPAPDTAQESLSRVRALVDNQRPAMVAAWLVGQRDGEERLTSVSVIRYRDVVEAIGED